MNIEIKEQNGSFIGRLYGWIDTAIATQFLEDMKPLMVHADKSIELNCAQLEYICSLGLRGLLQLKKESESKGGTNNLNTIVIEWVMASSNHNTTIEAILSYYVRNTWCCRDV